MEEGSFENFSYYTSMDLRQSLVDLSKRIGENFDGVTMTMGNDLEFQFTVHINAYGESRNTVSGCMGETPMEAFEFLLEEIKDEEVKGFGWPWWAAIHSDAKTREAMKKIGDWLDKQERDLDSKRE